MRLTATVSRPSPIVVHKTEFETKTVMEFPLYDDYEDEETSDNFLEHSDLVSDPFSLTDLWINCAIPSLDIFSQLSPIFGCCFALVLFRSVLHYIKRPGFIHFGSTIAGFLVIRHIHKEASWIVIVSDLCGYFMLSIASLLKAKFQPPFVAVLAVLYVVCCELFLLDPVIVNGIRGSQIIFLMKLISLSFGDARVSFVEYMGYIFFPGNLIFGPFISLETYRTWSTAGAWVSVAAVRSTSVQLFVTLISAASCLLISNCLMEWLLGDFVGRWIHAYQVAASFRFSHYFVGYFSEATIVAAGISWTPVTRPLKIELPRSLVEVVSYWSIPMRNWLRQFVFLKARTAFSVPVAIFLTYTASSLLHGVNFQLSAVLLTLSVATYVENEFRRKLASIFDACILARKCRNCAHKYGPTHYAVVITNFAFGLLVVFHLAYLGDMFDSSAIAEKGYDYFHTLSKWKQLDFAGHYVIMFTFFLQWLI